MRSKLIAAAVVTVLAVAQPAAAASPRSAFQDLLTNAVKPPVPGAILAVNGPGVRFSGAAGKFVLGGRDLRPTDAFRAASVTKTVTAATVLKLVEQNKVRLDDRISKYLDPALISRVDNRVTVRQLLDHTAGLYDYATDDGFMAEVQANPRRTWTPRDLLDWAFTHGQPYFAPGTGFHYSDTGYVLAGFVIEKVTGTPLHRAYRSLVLDPLGMSDTYLEYWERRHCSFSHAYLGAVDTRYWNPTFDTFGGGGLVTTAKDLTTFVRGLFEGKVFRQQATLDAMLTTTPQSGGTYGLGIERKGGMWFHPGFWGGFIGYVPERRLSIVATVNQADDTNDALITLVNDAYRVATNPLR
ncbi:serine hydrolase domain-containing protein [Actinocrispum wychmicini]|uniref:D-alanyl-D-alanine carboxypeptidase n=1 Tax=Actinocrispum wychmicini TaxID=1213861 RepID=A0A4R2IPU9_9PSEU|nr:serine hydrolase domain-containing protein [Actinocrispum wychmicini]TCO47371.1 D-alanyl-D-alanine carboxypeptidase [Actinocrispum wychmicini]